MKNVQSVRDTSRHSGNNEILVSVFNQVNKKYKMCVKREKTRYTYESV